jgi:hypothetical protein
MPAEAVDPWPAVDFDDDDDVTKVVELAFL